MAFVVALTVYLVASPAARAARAAFRPGDIIVAGYIPTANGYPETGTGKLRQFASDGTFIQEFYSREGSTVDAKFSPDGVLHTAGQYSVARFANDSTELPSFTAPSPYASHSLAFSRSGDLFATTFGGVAVKFGKNGLPELIPLEPVTFFSDWADLGADQCTLYYLRDAFAAPIGRFNVCSHTMLPPLPTTLNSIGGTLLVLFDGTLLVSTNLTMYRIRPDGTVVRRYNTAGVAYGRDPDPRYVWVSYGSKIARFDLQNDLFAAGPFETGFGVTGIAIVGADVQSIPALSPLLLALLALAVAVCAVHWLRT